MMNRLNIFLLAGLLAPLMTGCSTPEARIKQNSAAFNRFSPEVQANVRKGIIEVGYTKKMVEIALGAPDRKYQRKTAGGIREVWAYVSHDKRPERQRATGTFRVKSPSGGFQTVNDTVWLDVDRYYEYDRQRVEFELGKVVAIETADAGRTPIL